jgi:phosphopantothenoylcysteine synthetase/decarboxylase
MTNASTGELGVRLSLELARCGFEVFCIKGCGATFPSPRSIQKCHLKQFQTNAELLDLLAQTAASSEISAVFYAAALCDYQVKNIEDASGGVCNSPKISIRSGPLTIHLIPSTKVISHLRNLFPSSSVFL